jgi:hypothetical protein
MFIGPTKYILPIYPRWEPLELWGVWPLQGGHLLFIFDREHQQPVEDLEYSHLQYAKLLPRASSGSFASEVVVSIEVLTN